MCIGEDRIDPLSLPRAMSWSIAATRFTQISDEEGGATEPRLLHKLSVRALDGMAGRGLAPALRCEYRHRKHFDGRIGLSGCRRIDARERPRLWTQGVFTR